VQLVRHAPLPHVGHPAGRYKGKIVDEPEYEGWSGAGWTIGVTADKDGVAWLNTQLDRACLDVNEFGWLCGWVMEGIEKGWITKKQLGFELKWGDIAAPTASSR
jgi:aldehyde:ferredoxin oxidoreductase